MIRGVGLSLARSVFAFLLNMQYFKILCVILFNIEKLRSFVCINRQTVFNLHFGKLFDIKVKNNISVLKMTAAIVILLICLSPYVTPIQSASAQEARLRVHFDS